MNSRRITSIQFSPVDPQDIITTAACEIVSHDLYDAKGTAVPGGLFDPRMGTLQPRTKCHTCGNGPKDCPGHMGYIRLNEPMYYPHYIREVAKIASSVCLKCPPGTLCGHKPEKVKVVTDGGHRLTVAGEPLPARKVIDYLGDSKALMCTVLPVGPPCIRPNVSTGRTRNGGDLTTRYVDILKSNILLQKKQDDLAAETDPEKIARLQGVIDARISQCSCTSRG